MTTFPGAIGRSQVRSLASDACESGWGATPGRGRLRIPSSYVVAASWLPCLLGPLRGSAADVQAPPAIQFARLNQQSLRRAWRAICRGYRMQRQEHFERRACETFSIALREVANVRKRPCLVVCCCPIASELRPTRGRRIGGSKQWVNGDLESC